MGAHPLVRMVASGIRCACPGEGNCHKGKSMKRLVCVAAVAAALGGCVSAPIKTVGSADTLQGKKIVVTEYAKPDFAAQSPGKAMWGMFGAAAMIHAGNELVQKDDIADPSVAVAETLAQDLAAKNGDTLLPNQNAIAPNDDVSTLLKTYPGADLIIDVKTINWMYSYYPTKWNTYWVFYSARLRVLDGKTGNLVAQALCKAKQPQDPEAAPTGDQLLANNGQVLKDLLQKEGESCVGIYEQQILKI